MKRSPSATEIRILSTALVLAFSVDPSGAETFRWADSTASVQQLGGAHQSQSDVTRFEDGHRIITRDGNNTDITIQREGYGSPPLFDAEQRFRDGNSRFDGPDIERRFSHLDTVDSDCFFSEMPEASDMQRFFLFGVTR